MNKKKKTFKKPIVVGNWKMDPASFTEAKEILFSLKKKTPKSLSASVVLCPPSVYLPKLSAYTHPDFLSFGAQDCFWQTEGSYTGELSIQMLKDSGAEWVILGHSERRSLGETSDIVNMKLKTVLESGLIAILCVGEKERDDEGEYLSFLQEQLASSIKDLDPNLLGRMVIAYEPVWAIGRDDNLAMEGSNIHEMTIFIRRTLSNIFGRELSDQVPVIYGGSATPENIEDIITNGNVDGVLVGRASRSAEDFSVIIKSVVKQYGNK